MKATAIAPANIAFIKYWGKADNALRLPLNASISMNLSNATTRTTVSFSPDFLRDELTILSDRQPTTFQHVRKFNVRVMAHLDRLRRKAGVSWKARVVTQNSFPTGAGIASSASGFAALTVAAAAALGLELSEKDLSILARLGSGSACRSIPDGFVMWQKGNSHESSFASSLYPASHWDLRDVVCVVEQEEKQVGSTAGMDTVRTSPFWGRRVRDIPDRIKEVKRALARKDIERLGTMIEEDCVSMHAVAMTQKPPMFYWNGTTVELIHAVRAWRKEGLPVYFTIDAGSTVHLICEAKDEERVIQGAEATEAVKEIILNKPAPGAHTTERHLF